MLIFKTWKPFRFSWRLVRALFLLIQLYHTRPSVSARVRLQNIGLKSILNTPGLIFIILVFWLASTLCDKIEEASGRRWSTNWDDESTRDFHNLKAESCISLHSFERSFLKSRYLVLLSWISVRQLQKLSYRPTWSRLYSICEIFAQFWSQSIKWLNYQARLQFFFSN